MRRTLGCIAVIAVGAVASSYGAAMPEVGYVVTASVEISTRGPAARPTALRCAGKIGTTPLRGTARATKGQMTCTYRAPLSARGKTLRGTISFRWSGKHYVRRFSHPLT